MSSVHPKLVGLLPQNLMICTSFLQRKLVYTVQLLCIMVYRPMLISMVVLTNMLLAKLQVDGSYHLGNLRNLRTELL